MTKHTKKSKIMPSVSLEAEVYASVRKLAGILQSQSGTFISISDTIDYLIKQYEWHKKQEMGDRLI